MALLRARDLVRAAGLLIVAGCSFPLDRIVPKPADEGESGSEEPPPEDANVEPEQPVEEDSYVPPDPDDAREPEPKDATEPKDSAVEDGTIRRHDGAADAPEVGVSCPKEPSQTCWACCKTAFPTSYTDFVASARGCVCGQFFNNPYCSNACKNVCGATVGPTAVATDECVRGCMGFWLSGACPAGPGRSPEAFEGCLSSCP